jgi:hypothetical protein
MPDRPQFIAVPSLTPDEVAAQLVLRWATANLRLVILALRGVAAVLPEPEKAEEMGTGVLPESVSYSTAGTVEVVLHDDLLPALRSLHEASYLTPAVLVRDWQRAQEGHR